MKDYRLTGERFQRLLACLDEDADRAGEKYERIRGRLIKFFQWRECWPPEEYADRVFDRVAARLAEGSPLTAEDPYVYCYGVALNLVRESWREPVCEPLPEELAAPAAEEEQPEISLACLDDCLAGLAPESRRLLFEYHEGRGRRKIQARLGLASRLRIPMNALRIRVWRLRQSLASCVEHCVQRNETNRGALGYGD